MMNQLRIDKDKLIEKICRKLVKENGYDPDQRICRQVPELLQPPFIGAFVIPNEMFQIPYWFIYKEIVNAALEFLKEETDAHT